MVERILYIWAIRHPASGYVQGINDLVTPFLIVFLQEHVDQDVTRAHCQVDSLPQALRASIEADSFWCMTKVLDGIQDNYTFAQPGIQVKCLPYCTIMVILRLVRSERFLLFLAISPGFQF